MFAISPSAVAMPRSAISVLTAPGSTTTTLIPTSLTSRRRASLTASSANFEPAYAPYVGKTTFPGSLSCIKPRGLFVSFGNASGPVPPFAIAELNNHGSLFATRPKLNDYVAKRSELLEGADTLFAAVINGKLHVPINHAYALKDAAKAHTELEARATTGAAILRP